MPYTIWKIALKPAQVQDIEVPADAEMLTISEQFDQICVWFKCDPDKPTTKRRIAMVGTGDTAPEGARYIGTGFLYGGKLVLHVFERVNAVAQLSDL